MYLFENPVLATPSWDGVREVFAEVTRSSSIEGYYEPLTLVSLMIDVARGGQMDNLRPFHETNLALHVLNTMLIVLLLNATFRQPWVAAMGGLVFGIHPLTVEPVAWVWERKTPLAMLFALLCLLSYVSYARRRSALLYGVCLATFLLALLAKPTATPLPALLLLLDWWPLRRLDRRALLEKIPFFALAAVSAVITIISTRENAGLLASEGQSALWTPVRVCYLFFFYLGKILWPATLSPYYSIPRSMTVSDPRVLPSVLGMIAFVSVLLATVRRTRALAMGFAFFFLAILPTLGLVGYSWVQASDKYVYFPSVGLLIMGAGLLAGVWGRAPAGRGFADVRVRIGIVVVLLAASGAALTRGALSHWQSTAALYRHMLTVTPGVPWLLNAYGQILFTQGNVKEAVRWIDRALYADPDLPEAHQAMGAVLLPQQQYDEVILHSRQALHLKPALVGARVNLAAALAGQGHIEEAIAEYRRAIHDRPGRLTSHRGLFVLYACLGRTDDAIAEGRTLLEYWPYHTASRLELARLLAQRGRVREAVEEYEFLLRREPGHAEARSELDALLAGKIPATQPPHRADG